MELNSIGLMSGTSMDGIDAALVKTDGQALIEPVEYVSLDYDPETKILLKATEFAVRRYEGNLYEVKNNFLSAVREYLKAGLNLSNEEVDDTAAALARYLQQYDSTIKSITYDAIVQHSTRMHGNVVEALLKKRHMGAKEIDVIGYHGQTLYHAPQKRITVQVGDGQALADRTGIAVVNDFRSNDIEAGGQGAPLAPIYHQALAIRDNKFPMAVVNCGGIANVTFILGAGELDLMGFDTGPGNGLLDRYIRAKTQGKETMDRDGLHGLLGEVNENVLQLLYKNALVLKNGEHYLDLKPPKSLDINDMLLIPELDSLSLEDACATLAAFTADTIVDSLKFISMHQWPSYWVLAGGGWHNPNIRLGLETRLGEKLKELHVETADEAGWNSQFMEAEIFAYLAIRSLKGLPLTVPTTTGAPFALSGGHLSIPESGTTDAVNDLTGAR